VFMTCFRGCHINKITFSSDYHFEYTECDALGSRWRVAVPNKADICTGLPDPVKGTQCTFSCSEGEYLNMQSQQCQKCAAGTYSLGTGVAFDEWDSLPSGFVTQGVNTNGEDVATDCSNSTWTPKGDYIASNTDECTATLSYAVSLKKPGTVSFDYFYPDNSIYFEFFVQNDQCQSTDSQSRWIKISESSWSKHRVELNSGNNVLYWRATTYTLLGSAVKPVMLRNIAISGVAYTSECFHCKPGTHSAKQGSARCAPCPADTFSNKGATVCHQCDRDKYAEAGSASCKPRPACTNSDFFYTHTPCDSEGKTQLMYKWIEPKICSETVKGAVKLPASGDKQTCPPCNPGFFVTNSSTCEPCDKGFYSNGTACSECPVGSEPVVGFEYKWWNTMPKNMRSAVFRREFSDSQQITGETQRFTRIAQLNSQKYEHIWSECISLQGYNQWNNDVVEQWRGTSRKQSYSYLIQSNSTTSFTWTFQRTEEFNMRKYSADVAKIYSIHITNVLGGVASQCRHCALSSTKAGSACVPCPPGHYMVNGTGVCKSCPPNTFVRADQPVGEAACVQCGPNTETNKAHTACLSDCALDVETAGGAPLHYDFSPLANVSGFHSSPRFTNKGLRYFHSFNLGLCGKEVRMLATCVDNVTESGREVRGYICQSTVVPSDIRSQSVNMSQGGSLVLYCRHVCNVSRSSETTQACKQGRSAAIRLRCNPTVTTKDLIMLPSNCSEGTCDGCTFHFLWESQHACPLCTKNHYREIVSACIQGIQRTTYVWQQPLQCYGGESLPAQKVSACVTLDFWLKFGVSTGTVAAVLLVTISCYFWKKTRKLQYKYSKLMMNSRGKECELPTADSCAIMEGEDAEDDIMYLSKRSVFSKIRSYSREVIHTHNCECIFLFFFHFFAYFFSFFLLNLPSRSV
uniref:Endosome-lysosome associated apoptosis and autophagy regulator 1 n=1 Tax=Sparus aurata TaxID=8175 RepID=A0A671YK37_SPAAU